MRVNRDAEAFILAGGQSRRMGQDKAMLRLRPDGKPLLIITAQLVASIIERPIVIGPVHTYESLGLRIINDDIPGMGPLGGIATALPASEKPWNLILACDLPYLTKQWLEYLVGRGLNSKAQVVVPVNARGLQPLCAMYHKNCEPVIRGALDRGIRRVTDAVAELEVETISESEAKRFDPEGLLFQNMNSPADYEEAKARLRSGASS